MRNFYLTFTSDKIDKMKIFGALLDAGMENFVITESIEVGDISEAEEKCACLSCEYGKEALYCARDDVYVLKEEVKASEKCELWSEKDAAEEPTVPKNATVEFVRCKDCAFFENGYCNMRKDEADGEMIVCPSFLLNIRKIDLIEE